MMRSALDKIRRRRTNRATVFLLTGGTGFLGSHLAVDLLRKSYKVILLVRPHKGSTARQRVDRMLNGFGMAAQHYQHLEVLEGSLQGPRFDLNENDFLRLLGDVDEIIHCASDTSFTERRRTEVERVNIGGMGNVLDFAVNGWCYFFHYLSTAYAAGEKTGVCQEELGENKVFTNVYEETKYRAERMAYDRCSREGIRLSIYRPSVVCGDSKTGRATQFIGFYSPLRTVLFLKDLYSRDIRERGGQKAREMGVKYVEDGSLHLPIRMEVTNHGGVNLIPVDYFTNAFIALMEECLEGGIFHIVNPKPKRIEDLMEYTKRLFQIDGIEPCQAEDFNRKPKTMLERVFDSYLRVYNPYMRDQRMFDNRKAQSILARKGIVCPDFDSELFSRCANYAVACDWGRKAFDRKNAREEVHTAP